MKFIQLLVIFLLISFILFVMFQVEEVEGFTVKNIEGYSNLDDDLPACGRNRAGVPSCGSVPKDDYLNDFNRLKKDKYILKTKIVTPVCPKDPYNTIGSEWPNEDKAAREKREREEREAREARERRERALSNNYRDISMNNVRDTSSNKKNDKDTDEYEGSRKDVAQANFFNSNTMLNQNVIATPEKKEEPVPAKAEDKKSEPEDISKCPPCPACERCPEPTVDCKKVVKYKNQNYPVPVIADFSNFSRFG
jgi:hypothetical protein